MFIAILVTAKDVAEAEKIGRTLVEQKLIACANILSGVKSVFWWQEKIDTSDEVLLILKTKKSLFKKVEKAVKSLHSYDTPEVIALPISQGSKEYLKWISDSVD